MSMIINPYRFATSGGGGAGAEPDTLSNLVGWWKADAITGKSDGDPLSTWPDSSSASTDLTQSTGSKQPTYKTSIVNGKPVVRFDGSSDIMFRSRLYTDDIFTIFVVVKGASQSNQSIVNQESGNADTGRIRFVGTSSAKALVFFNNGSSHSASTATSVFGTGNFHIVQSASDGSGNTAMRVDGGTDEATITGQTVTPLNFSLCVGAVGANNNEGAYFTGDIAEIVCYDAHHSDADRSDVVDHLADKYGITL